jgi:hypothetical protein
MHVVCPFFLIQFYLQAMPLHSANCVETYAMSCRRVPSSAQACCGLYVHILLLQYDMN